MLPQDALPLRVLGAARTPLQHLPAPHQRSAAASPHLRRRSVAAVALVAEELHHLGERLAIARVAALGHVVQRVVLEAI